MSKLDRLLSTMPGATVSLVMNAAYDTPRLQAQLRAFGRLPSTDLLFTRPDEEPRWSKLWNFVLGTNCSLSFLAAGQNFPGTFSAPHLRPCFLRKSGLPDEVFAIPPRWQLPC